MEHKRSWFWRNIAFWFVPPKWGRDEWARFSKRSRPASRKVRRRLAVVWIGIIALYAGTSFLVAWLVGWYGAAVILPLAMTLGIPLILTQASFSCLTLQDRALIEYGKEIMDLDDEQRAALWQQAALGVGAKADEHEREAARQRTARTRRIGLIQSCILLPAIVAQLILSFRFGSLRPLLHLRFFAWGWGSAWAIIFALMVLQWMPEIRGESPERSVDERDSERQNRSQSAAYRVMRRLLPLVLLACWGFCFLQRYQPIRQPFLMAAIGLTWFAIFLAVLPVLIRLWTDPDHPGEPEILTNTP